MVEAILFDMDGVLIDSEPVHQAATDEVARAAGLGPVSEETFARYFFGRTDFAGFGRYLETLGRPELFDELLAAKADAFAIRFAAEVRPYHDGLTALRGAHEAGYRIAIVSGARNSEIDLVVQRFGLAPRLDLIVGGDDVPRGKPDPAPYRTAAERLGLPAARCLVVEDAPPGVASARAAGMRCLAVDRLGRPEALDAADVVVSQLSLRAIVSLASSALE